LFRISLSCWKTWVNGEGLTTRIREHLESHHLQEYRTKCQQEGVTVPALNLSSAEDDVAFSPRLLAEYLAQWAAIDDQVRQAPLPYGTLLMSNVVQAMRVVERYEFRRVLLLCSRAPKLRDSDIPHRTKLTAVTTELYKAEMARIKHELKVSSPFLSA
jgi:hypothetical protein